MYPTYAEWLAGIKDWLDVADYSDARVDIWLQMANTRLNKDLNSRHMERTEIYTVPASTSNISLATVFPDFNRMINVNVEGLPSIPVVATNEMQNFIAAVTNGEIVPSPTNPVYHCVVGDNLTIFPYPLEGVNLVLQFYTMVPPLGPTVAANAFSINHPNALLWAALGYGSKFIVEDDRGTMYENNYLNEVDVINKAAKAEKMGSTPLKRMFSVYATKGNAM